MAWVESHTVISRHRKLKELARSLRLKPVYVMGHLHALWHDALEQQEDGDLTKWSDGLIAESSQFDGDAPEYVSLLQEHGWLDGRMIHHWLDYAGRYLESKYRTSNPNRLIEIWSKHGLVWLKSGLGRSLDSPPTLPNQPDLTKPNQPNQTKKHLPAPEGDGEPFWKALIGHVNDSWTAAKRGAKYPWSKKDFAALKRLSKIYEPWGVMALWDAYLKSGDQWAKDHGYDVPTFSTQIPKLVDDAGWRSRSKTYQDKLDPASPDVAALLSGLGKPIVK